ncbi:hypothetical protein TWF694_005631 [Orbilia ellipsospora]|uniref:F-box domain-containing protein n=1 Tax=Orbilia ellipsospora TaxID=2528407 RepID=A0AAV9WV96_9PEZI
MTKRRRLFDDPLDCEETSGESVHRLPKRRFFGKSPLLDLPQELILRVLHFLPVQTLLTVSRTSRKLHSLASDPQLWKSKFWAKFIHPRLQRRQRLCLPDAFDHRSEEESPFASDWKKWLEDHVLIQEERDLAIATKILPEPKLSPSKLTKPPINPPALDWKAKFRLRSNWQRGTARSNQLHLLDSSPKIDLDKSNGEKCSKGPPIIGSFFEGYFFAIDPTHGVRVYSCRNLKTTREPLAQRPNLLGEPTCLRIEESLLNDASHKRHKMRGIDFVVGYSDGSFSIFHFDPISNQLSDKFSKRCFGGMHRTELVAFYFPYLVIITRLNELSILSFHSSMIKPLPNSLNPKLGLPPPDRPYFKPELVSTLMVDIAWYPACLSFRKDPGSGVIVASIVFSVRNMLIGSSITIQEFRLSPDTPELLESHVSSPPLFEALSQAFFGRTAHMAFTTPTCVSYRYPFILTSHADNTIVLYHLYTHEDGKLGIQAGHQLWGHNTSVMAVEVGLRKAVSVDRRGEVRVWDLQGRYEKTYGRDRSVRVGGSGDPLFLNLDGKKGVQTERCLIGFDEEDIVVMGKVKDLDQSRTDFRLTIYNFT